MLVYTHENLPPSELESGTTLASSPPSESSSSVLAIDPQLLELERSAQLDYPVAPQSLYDCINDNDQQSPAQPEPAPSAYKSLKKAELKSLCKERKIKGYSDLNHQRLVDLLESWDVKKGVVSPQSSNTALQSLSDDEVRLVQELDADGEMGAMDVLGYADDDLGHEEVDDLDLEDDADFQRYKVQVRMRAADAFEANRRIGGIRTQESCVKDWQKFAAKMISQKKIRDDVPDAHSLVLYMEYTSNRPRFDQKGREKPGTFVGASQIKKLFFGALRIRKTMDAADPELAGDPDRKVTTIYVWDMVKACMSKAIERDRDGTSAVEDAPDITANTFLETITDDEIHRITLGFLDHRELHAAIKGFLAWTCQNASGKRGDDYRAMKLAELQLGDLLHPNGLTSMKVIFGLQSEGKTHKRGLSTIVNPTFSVFLRHLDPLKDPFGAYAIYFHYLFDQRELLVKIPEIDFTVNKSWRGLRILHGKAPTVPYSEQCLYNLYRNACQYAGVATRMKQHLPRHLLGYYQERMGVDPSETQKLGWSSNETFHNVYRPAFPKVAILAAHGFKVHEPYEPPASLISVPPHFLKLVCPMAEEMVEKIQAALEFNPGLRGALNFWNMIIHVREALFQCGAAIFAVCPRSPIFRLPAFQDPQVINWMKNVYPAEIARITELQGQPIDLSRIQDREMRMALHKIDVSHRQRSDQMLELILDTTRDISKISQRTALFSPEKPLGMDGELRRARFAQRGQPLAALASHPTFQLSVQVAPHPDPAPLPALALNESSAMSFPTPLVPAVLPPPTAQQLPMVLPPVEACLDPARKVNLLPAIYTAINPTWDDVLDAIHRPRAYMLWDSWRPEHLSLGGYTIRSLWACWDGGEAKMKDGSPQGIKPPLRKIEAEFAFSWRSTKSADKKFWSRFIEIPQYIDRQYLSNSTSPRRVIEALEQRRLQEGALGQPISLNQLQELLSRERKEGAKSRQELPQNEWSAALLPSVEIEGSSSGSEGPESSSGNKRKRGVAWDARARPSLKKRKDGE